MANRLTVTRPIDFIEFHKQSILQGIHQRIEEQTRLYPEKTALKGRDASYNYADLNGRANALADAILSMSGGALAQTGILLPNTPELIVAMLASLKAHKAYVPLDYHFPKDRLRMMVNDAEPVVLLTDDRRCALAEELARKETRIINISQMELPLDAPNPNVPVDPLDRAYILYTSGSTGRPKGIAFLHRNLLHTTMCLTNELFFSPSDRVSWLHSPSFGSSVVDIYCCLMNGGTLFPWDTKALGFTGMADWAIQNKLSTIQWIPTAFRQFMRTVRDELVFEGVRIVVLAGEPLALREVDLFRRHFASGSHLVNQVGTAESYNYYLYRVDHQIQIEDTNVPGGYPVSPERQVLILNDERQELPRGCVGEIAIKSDYMSAGYWRDESLTSAKFVRFGEDPTPVYLTGDLGKLEPDGCLIHLGRSDYQVKIRGCRVELAEIDHLLASAPGVADATAWIAKNRLGEDQLVGYVVPRDSGQFNQREVEEYMSARLPRYMVPTQYVALESLPTLPTGKADRRALPNPFDRKEAPARGPDSGDPPLVQTILGVFEELLEVEDLGADSSFLEEGGDSLLAAVLAHRIHQLYNVEIPPDDFLELPTASRLARLIERALEDRGGPHTADALETETPDKTAPTGRKSRQASAFPEPAPGKTQNLVIIGAGPFGREVFTWATQAISAGAPWRIRGFLDDRRGALDGYDYVPAIIGDVDTYQIEEDDVFIGAIGDPADKLKYYSVVLERGGRFVNLIHPLATIGKNVRLGTGIVLAPFTSITSDVTVGDHVSMGAFSNAGHDAVIGDWSQISSHCGINGGAVVGQGVFLGSHACIIPGVSVRDWAFVGAGSIVVRDVASRVKVFGNPATPIGRNGAMAGVTVRRHLSDDKQCGKLQGV